MSAKYFSHVVLERDTIHHISMNAGPQQKEAECGKKNGNNDTDHLHFPA